MDGLTPESLLFGPVFVGLGCRRGCGWEEIAGLVVAAFDEAGLPGTARTLAALAAPAMKAGEAGLAEAARTLGLPLRFVGEDAMLDAQDRAQTRSATVLAAVGLASVAEAAALAAAGPGSRLLLPRRSTPRATVALALPAIALPKADSSVADLPETRS
ncbi:cobalamin biosynthesis protein [Azospirillum picis]|uniref:Cobalt-precorrin 5A hydrolase n=1 Tax=Azospirillum picis TaxID=488438 RepID=A0ABU0MD29_9PROT|nr:cobalamin biosynthesis protein [Azospirillum picis]MBP2297639.1 cobalt-precorrin 5A hydrolase [Azospirillum picis]MDQ0531338.1 cobalt-precorrin 5A hydrolase [Azospirillum picis]